MTPVEVCGQVVQRATVRTKWNAFCDDHPSAWWWHRNEWLDYSLAYTEGAEDYSTAELNAEGNIERIFPLVLSPENHIVTGGREPVPMLTRGIHQEEVGSAPTAIIDLTTWTIQAIRKSYRGLIRQQCEAYTFLVFDYSLMTDPLVATVAEAMMEEIQTVHWKAAGRRTRSQRTWELMSTWLCQNHALLCVALQDWQVVGYLYAICYKQHAYYASGATLRECGHGLQFKVIRYLQEHVLTYDLGVQAHPTTEKEKAINFFKSGWGGGRG